MTEFALQWLMSQPHVDSVILSKIEHLKENLKAADGKLDEATVNAALSLPSTIIFPFKIGAKVLLKHGKTCFDTWMNAPGSTHVPTPGICCCVVQTRFRPFVIWEIGAPIFISKTLAQRQWEKQIGVATISGN